MERLGGVLGVVWKRLGVSWTCLEEFFAFLSGFLEHLAGFSVVSRCIGGRSEASWKRLEGILEATGGVHKEFIGF